LDSYLNIASSVLDAERRPLSPKTILEAAYRYDLVPARLHGQTQHKTLQARISEDIIARRDNSLFFRTEPGKFFLRKYLTDTSLPEEFRTVFPTRRRIRELARGPSLALERTALQKIAKRNVPFGWRKLIKLLQSEHYRYEDPRFCRNDFVFVRSFVCIFRGDDLFVLCVPCAKILLTKYY
jgi:hypothetical protein